MKTVPVPRKSLVKERLESSSEKHKENRQINNKLENMVCFPPQPKLISPVISIASNLLGHSRIPH